MFNFFRVLRSVISEVLINHSENYVWEQNMYFVALNNATDLFMWYRFIVSFLPTVLMLYVIYFIPNRQGQISHYNESKNNIKIVDSDVDEALSSAEDDYEKNEATPELIRPKKTTVTNEQKQSFTEDQDSLGYFLAKEYEPRLKKSTRTANNERKFSKNDSTDRYTSIN